MLFDVVFCLLERQLHTYFIFANIFMFAIYTLKISITNTWRYLCTHKYIHAHIYLKLHFCYFPAHIHFLWSIERTVRNGLRDSNGCRALLVKIWFSKHWLKWHHLEKNKTNTSLILFSSLSEYNSNSSLHVRNSVWIMARVGGLVLFLSSSAPPRRFLIPANDLHLHCSFLSWKKMQQKFHVSKWMRHFESHWNQLSNFSLVNL